MREIPPDIQQHYENDDPEHEDRDRDRTEKCSCFPNSVYIPGHGCFVDHAPFDEMGERLLDPWLKEKGVKQEQRGDEEESDMRYEVTGEWNNDACCFSSSRKGKNKQGKPGDEPDDQNVRKEEGQSPQRRMEALHEPDKRVVHEQG